jgi:heme-degrading monooxygenase HmoA
MADSAANADAYQRHVTTNVFPSLSAIAGHRGAYVLRRTTADQVEFLVITLWDSMDSIRSFAGDNPESAVVEPEARAVLSDFDKFVQHYEIAHDTTGKAG